MKPATIIAFNLLREALANTYGVETVERQFTIEPTEAQTLQDKIVELDSFLSRINVVTVDEQKGQNILGSVSGPVSGRVNTSVEGQEREPRDVLGLDSYGYECHQTNSDIYMKYATMDAWAKFKDLPERYSKYFMQRIANDRVIIGWHGTSAAADTDLVANPLMQDVNIGWIQYMKNNLAENIITTGEVAAGEIRIGTGGDYENLDHAIADMTEGIPQFLRQNLVALIGSELIGTEKALLYKGVSDTPTEKALAAMAMTTFGGLSWETPNNFPSRGLVLTSLDNLSIYVQDGTWRRHIKEKPEKDRVEDFNSRNEAYLVETPEKFVGLDFTKVKLPATGGTWA